ncbi:MAG: type II toxin-antitoxin system VapC family toxin [Acidimicrobiaceae bacterium]|nr:type II toxin-antitoxin system VapC family toxin [Acidimicrobiaceae bacterium]MCY4280523.1 type II toxin-antitoxin system VapC family toxin [Acidimicrobiaceae bacterium]MCY4293643.1 type II toxin-antitoxin system VapC family toxin [Acidimicrobiaceae bacterium]
MAILLREPDAERFAGAIAGTPHPRMSAAALLEASIVLESRCGPAAGYELDAFIQETGIDLEAVTAEHAQAARRAWRRFGKGNHPAGLNFGDCFAYGLAEAARQPLLFKGGDFDLTDIEAA